MPNDVALFDHPLLRDTLNRLVDSERLNGGDIRLTVGAVDVTSGEEVFFDTNNLPLDPLFAPEPERDLLRIASDLFSLSAPRPQSLDAVLERANDRIFASAGRRAIAGLAREYALRKRLEPDGPAVRRLHVTYKAGPDQLAAKSFDFSPSSIRDRWEAGRRDMTLGMERLEMVPAGGGRFVFESV